MGNRIEKRLPLPIPSLSAVIVPPCASTMDFAMARPSPDSDRAGQCAGENNARRERERHRTQRRIDHGPVGTFEIVLLALVQRRRSARRQNRAQYLPIQFDRRSERPLLRGKVIAETIRGNGMNHVRPQFHRQLAHLVGRLPYLYLSYSAARGAWAWRRRSSLPRTNEKPAATTHRTAETTNAL